MQDFLLSNVKIACKLYLYQHLKGCEKMENANIFSSRLKTLRKENNLTLDELHSKTGISISALSRYEKGTRIPKIEQIQKLADFFNVPVYYLQGIANDDEVKAFERSTNNNEWAKKFSKIIDSEVTKGSEKYDIIANLLLGEKQLAEISNINNVDKDDIYSYVNYIFKYMTFESINDKHQVLDDLKTIVKKWRTTNSAQDYSNWIKGRSNNNSNDK